MADTRQLPQKRNALLMPENAPRYEALVERRRLGQTDLTKQGSTPAKGDKDAPSTFDYAHLRAPLPKNIVSGIFKPAPASYFLMRRSSDGYVSATGMFKAAFPYSEVEDEERERSYLRTLPTTSHEETAGNIWIPPMFALQLAEEYGITNWIRALLDPAPINVKETAGRKITHPPTFSLPPVQFTPPRPAPEINPKTGEALRRSRRSVSPSKAAPARKIATPRKTRKGATVGPASSSDSLKQALHAAANATESSPTAGATSSVADTEESRDETVESPASEVKVFKANKAEPKESKRAASGRKSKTHDEDAKVTVHVDQDVEVNKDGEEITHTHVEVQMPEALFAPMPPAEDTAALIAEATKMVEVAVKANGMTSTAEDPEDVFNKIAKVKRKAEDMAADEDAEGGEVDAEGLPVVKRVRVDNDRDLKKEKVKTRALIGISATLAIGALIPYVMGAF